MALERKKATQWQQGGRGCQATGVKVAAALETLERAELGFPLVKAPKQRKVLQAIGPRGQLWI